MPGHGRMIMSHFLVFFTGGDLRAVEAEGSRGMLASQHTHGEAYDFVHILLVLNAVYSQIKLIRHPTAIHLPELRQPRLVVRVKPPIR